jgi:hypothetical protein
MGDAMPGNVETVRAEALFASTLQSSAQPAAQEIRGAVAATLRHLGIAGCVGEVAGEFGEHPDCAVTRMRWAIAMVRSVYPVPAARRAPPPMVCAG